MAALPPLHYGLDDVPIPENPPPSPPHFRIIEIVASFLGTDHVGPFLATHMKAELIIGLSREEVVEEQEGEDQADENQDKDGG